MKLEECKTVKECLIWAESKWPGFWDFATQEPMTDTEFMSLAEKISSDESFDKFIDRFQECIPAKDLLDQETIQYLVLGAQAMERFNEQKR